MRHTNGHCKKGWELRQEGAQERPQRHDTAEATRKRTTKKKTVVKKR